MSMRSYYFAVVGIAIIIMGGSLLLIHRHSLNRIGNPHDVVWLERLRRSTLDGLAPLRSRVHVSRTQVSMIMSGNAVDQYATTTIGDDERQLALEMIDVSRARMEKHMALMVPERTPLIPRGVRRLYELRDRLWELTDTYVDTLEEILEGDAEVYSVEFNTLEEQLQRNTEFMDEEIANLGIGPVE